MSKKCQLCGCNLRDKQRSKWCDPCKPTIMLERRIRSASFREIDEMARAVERYCASPR